VKRFLFGLLLIAVFGCSSLPSKKKYIVIVQAPGLDIVSSQYRNEVKVDTIEAENDSVAYMQGVFSYAAEMRVAKKLHPKYLPKGFEVHDQNGTDISYRLSEGTKDKANTIIKEE
jgi:hypothetical protein